MDFRDWKRRYKKAIGGSYKLSYRPYSITKEGYELGEEISREAFEQYRVDTNKAYDYKSNITVRPLVSDTTQGFFEYSSNIKEEKSWEVEEKCLEQFIVDYQITDKDALADFLEFGDVGYSTVEKLQALSQLPNLLRKFQ